MSPIISLVNFENVNSECLPSEYIIYWLGTESNTIEDSVINLFPSKITNFTELKQHYFFSIYLIISYY